MTPQIKGQYSDEIVNNDILKLQEPQPNLASRVLSKFTKVLYRDFYKRYDIRLRGIVSLTFGENDRGVERTGISYKAANWKYDEYHGKKPRPSNLDTTHEEELRLTVPKDEPEAPTVELLEDNPEPTGVEN